MTPAGRAARAAFLAAFAVLLLTTDDRFYGAIPDGQETTSSAFALAHFGELGISCRWAYVAQPRAGACYSRYGVLQSVLLVPSVLAGRVAAAAAPSRPSAPFFALLPILLLALAAGGVAASAALLGVPHRLAFLAGLFAVLSTPLWGYAGSDYSEPLQVAALAWALAAALALRGANGVTPSREAAAGAALGALPLAKSALWPAAVLLLFLCAWRPAEPPSRRSRRPSRRPLRLPLLAAFAGAGILWAALELVRFGHLFGGYEKEGFDYPFLSGLLRLTFLPNKGLFVYAPAALLAIPGLLHLWRSDRTAALALGVPVGLAFATAAPWWAWDGQAGWGPRLVLVAVPAFAIAAAVLVDRAGAGIRGAAALLVAAGVGVNALGALQPFPGVYALATQVPPAPISESRAAGTPYEIERGPDGTLRATGPHHLSLTPAWSPIRLHALLLLRRLAGRGPEGDGLGTEPPFAPVLPAAPSAVSRAALSRFRWPFWGRSFLFPDGNAVDPYADALRDQALRASASRLFSREAALGATALAWPPARRDPRALALGAEGAERSGDAALAQRLRDALPACHPWALFVRGASGSCLAPDEAARFDAALSEARAAGVTLAEWAAPR